MLTTSKRILIFSLAYHPIVGGAEIAVKEITNRISDIEFDVITLRLNKTHLKVEKIGNCTVYRIGGGWGYLSKILFIPKAALFGLKLAKKKRYDALWAIMTYMLFPITLMRFFGNRTPYILTLQDGDPFEHVFKRLRIKIFLPLLKYGFRHASKVQAISNFLAKWAKQLGYKRDIEVIPNGVDVERFKIQDLGFKNKDQTILITTSRLAEKNGIKDIINALKFLPSNIKLKILGVGPLESELKLLAENLSVEFAGFVSQDEIPKHLHDADIFIRPSLSEGMGSSFIEAMAAGLPIIGTPVGGIPDFLTDGETGVFCRINDPKSIAEQVERLMSDNDLRRRLVENGQKLVAEKYDWNLIAKRMKEEIFDKV